MKRRRLVGISITIVILLAGLTPVFYPPARHPGFAWKLFRASAPERLPVPVPGIRPQDIADTFDAPRPEGRKHKGIDIFAPRP